MDRFKFRAPPRFVNRNTPRTDEAKSVENVTNKGENVKHVVKNDATKAKNVVEQDEDLWLDDIDEQTLLQASQLVESIQVDFVKILLLFLIIFLRNVFMFSTFCEIR
jgi:hypothetical protein